ncbi:hypothetical protein LARV_01430 [Longilinea arvoryzae]|uniref:Uncharacterized protein n=1 Tax=Longilinea arvoryzae TaxID=360412 RepID=A0A0S7BIG4_9CHLR|nr:hypothetical protein LARV_01430 [Longilinea arvoryzae]
MRDLVLIVSLLLFFALSFLMIKGIEKLRD